MLRRLQVHDLGVIASLSIDLEPGLTVITGETGAGKTLIVEAIELICGGRAEATMVRAGANDARINALFDKGDDEHLVTRTVPADGRSRAEIDGSIASVAMLENLADGLVDLHGQHAHQSLLRPAVQRAALDRFGAIDLTSVRELVARRREIDNALERLGGDEATRAREIDLLRYEIAEITAAAIEDDGEEERLEQEEDLLANVAALREAAASATGLLDGEGAPGAIDLIGDAIALLNAFETLSNFESRLRAVHAELGDTAGELRRALDRYEEDPERLAIVRARRELLRRLSRKHGGTLSDVRSFAEGARARLDELLSADAARAELQTERDDLEVALAQAEQIVGAARRASAPRLSAAVEAHLGSLALPGAQFFVHVGNDRIGDDVEFQLAANPGERVASLAKAASGGELARVMLALRLVLTSGPDTLVFDEVDAGIGGEAALAVGAALSALGATHQVLVVTHLAQVAAHADHHYVVDKATLDGRTVAEGSFVEREERLVELARMLSGQPNSPRALEHAGDLLQAVGPGSAR